MTGFGRSIVDFNYKKITVEIKSLNSKQLDLSIRIPNIYRDKELEYRSFIAKELSRGKIDLIIKVESNVAIEDFSININIAQQYYNELKLLEKSLNIDSKTDYLSLLIKMPDVINNTEVEISEEEWSTLDKTVKEAISNLKKYRADEGAVLKQDFIKRIKLILDYLSQIEPFEKNRINKVKESILNSLNQLTIDYDKNRFEQELTYYLEKLDITEEKVRLANHCNYFLQTIDNNESEGKKLGFITQEIGREINTVGSKANDTNIQQLVVKMKDELEKIREQLANIL